jgi:hypothetical protein
MSLYYYFGWGMKTGRDIEKFILWIRRMAHFDRFGHIEYNDNIRHMIFETADAYGNHYTDYQYADKLDRKFREVR